MTSHDLALVYLQGAAGADFRTALQRLLNHDPKLDMFSSEERVKLFALWVDRGDSGELARAVIARPDWMGDAWRSIAKYHASRKDFRRAFEIVRTFGAAPAMPQTVGRIFHRPAP